MTAVHFGAFNAEAAWRGPNAAALPEVVDRQAQRVVEVTGEVQFPLCGEGDVLLLGRELVPSHREYLASVGFRFEVAREGRWPGARPSPYAVVPGVEERCARHGLVGELPSVEVARRVNSKVYSHGLAVGLELFGAGEVVRSVEELSEVTLPCVVKDPFGVSGKGSSIVRERAELARLLMHLMKQRDAGREIELLVQPLYERATDFSCHFEVGGGFRPLGVQVMDNEGLAFSAVRAAPRELVELLEARGQWRVMERVAGALERDGYRGPVCVDAMVLRDGTLVPLLEINARKSMGLINLRLGARVEAQGLRSHLTVLNLSFRRAVTFDEVLDALRRAGLLYAGDARAGVLPLSGNAVIANLPGNAGETSTGGSAANNDHTRSASNDGARSANNDNARSASNDNARSASNDNARSASNDNARSASNDNVHSASNDNARSASNDNVHSASNDSARSTSPDDLKASEAASRPDRLRARGRLYLAVLVPSTSEATHLLRAVGACLESIGVDLPRRPA